MVVNIKAGGERGRGVGEFACATTIGLGGGGRGEKDVFGRNGAFYLVQLLFPRRAPRRKYTSFHTRAWLTFIEIYAMIYTTLIEIVLFWPRPSGLCA